MGTILIAFRLDKESLKKFEEIAQVKGMKRAEALRDAVKEYISLYRVDAEITVGRLHRRVQDIEKRLATIENLLMKKGATQT